MESILANMNGESAGANAAAILLLGFVLLTGVLPGCASTVSGLHVELPKNVEIPQDPMTGRPRLEFTVKPLTAELVESQVSKYEREKLIPTYPDLENSEFEYRISPYDVLQIIVWDHPELSTSAPVAGSSISGDIAGHLVDRSGFIFFPYVGELYVANKTIAEIRQELTTSLSKFIPAPQLDVRVSAYRSKRVFVLGQVENAGAVTLNDIPMRVLDAITMSDGITESADLSNVKLIRDGKAIDIDLGEIYFNGNLKQNYLLQNEDIIQVPGTDKRKIYMVGEFRKPIAFGVGYDKVTLADAIAKADGFNENTANANYVLIFRMLEEEKPVIYLFNANVPEHMLLSTQFVLEPHDIVYVPPTGLTQWSRIVQQILPTLNTLARLTVAARNWQIIVD
jgi:polysaccharide biosynthesis/export protein